MAYDLFGNQDPYGRYSTRLEARQAGWAISERMSAEAQAEYERQKAAPASPLLGLGLVALIGHVLSTELGLTFEQAMNLLVGTVIAIAVAGFLFARRRTKRAARAQRLHEAQALGFATTEDYEQAASERRSRLGEDLYSELADDALRARFQEGKKGAVGPLEFEQILAATASARGIDASVVSRGFVRPILSIRETLGDRLRSIRFSLFARTLVAAALFAVGAYFILASVKIADGVVGAILTAPFWLGWGVFGAFLAFTSIALEAMLLAIHGLSEAATRASQRALDVLIGPLARSSAGVALSELPGMLTRWKEKALGESEGRGILARTANLLAGWALGQLQRRTLRELTRRTQKLGAKEVTFSELEAALTSGFAAMLQGPLKTKLSLVRFVASTLLTVNVLITIALVWLV